MSWKQIFRHSKTILPPIGSAEPMSVGGPRRPPTRSITFIKINFPNFPKIRLNVGGSIYNSLINERKTMSNFYDSTCEICGYGFDIDDLMKVVYTDLSEKVFCYSCVSPEQENEDNAVVMVSTWTC